MKRIIDHFLQQWKQGSIRKPLLIRGARQVGKTYSVRKFGESYKDFVEINFELTNAKVVFEKDLDPVRIIRELSLITKKQIIPGKTLLFLDEIQAIPRAIIALRYFYEMMPDLHVVAAGSLLDFAIEQYGIPVGRVQFLYMYPLSFIEYLSAIGEKLFIEEILKHKLDDKISEIIHNKALGLLGEYLAIGGMPHSVKQWVDKKNPLDCSEILNSLLIAYQQDFSKYAKKLQIKYVELIFNNIPLQLAKKFKYSLVDGDYRKRELAPALDLLVTAGVANKVFYSSSQGIPLGGQIDPRDYKVVFLDIGLAQSVLDFDVANWFLHPKQELINKGSIVEAFVGQELLAYSNPQQKSSLYYWHKEDRVSQAEIDYIVQIKNSVIPVEVKSGSGRTLQSVKRFLETHVKSPYAIKFSTQNYSNYQNIQSYPLYAISKVISDVNLNIKQAIESLI